MLIVANNAGDSSLRLLYNRQVYQRCNMEKQAYNTVELKATQFHAVNHGKLPFKASVLQGIGGFYFGVQFSSLTSSLPFPSRRRRGIL